MDETTNEVTLRKEELLILSNFSVTFDLHVMETRNSSINAHAVIDNFVCITNRRTAEAEDKKEDNVTIMDRLRINDCHVHQFFAKTLTKGKKAGYMVHKVCLDKIIEYYKNISGKYQECS